MIKEKVLGKKWRAYTTIDGNACKEEQRIGYCWSEIHRGYLTVRLMKEHQCCERNCRHFQKYEDAQYWKQKEKRKSEKKKAKEIEKQNERDKQLILEKVRELTKEDNDFFAIGVEKERNTYIIRYIRFEKVDITKYIKLFKEVLGVSIFLKEIKTNYESKLNILKVHKLLRK